MRGSSHVHGLLFFTIALLAGCIRSGQTEPAPPTATATAEAAGQGEARQEADEIVFRAKYFRSRECVEFTKGVLANGFWDAYEVVEVVRGELAMKRLLGPAPPEGVTEWTTHTFRWKPSAATRAQLREAEKSGYKGIRLDAAEFAVVRPMVDDP